MKRFNKKAELAYAININGGEFRRFTFELIRQEKELETTECYWITTDKTVTKILSTECFIRRSDRFFRDYSVILRPEEERYILDVIRNAPAPRRDNEGRISYRFVDTELEEFLKLR